MPRKKKAPNTLLASAMVEDTQARLFIEVHKTATFNKFFLTFSEDIATGSRRAPMFHHRGSANDLEQMLAKTVRHVQTILKRKVVNTGLKIYRPRLYKKLLQTSPDKLGLVKLDKAATTSGRQSTHIPLGGYTSLQTKMDILTGRKGRRG